MGQQTPAQVIKKVKTARSTVATLLVLSGGWMVTGLVALYFDQFKEPHPSALVSAGSIFALICGFLAAKRCQDKLNRYQDALQRWGSRKMNYRLNAIERRLSKLEETNDSQTGRKTS